MRRKPLQPVDALKIAQTAKDYARSVIKKGSTQVENNNLEYESAEALFMAMGTHGYKDTGIRSIVPDKLNPLEDPTVSYYEAVIQISEKYSLGNCFELAVVAMDCILNQFPDVPAEIYEIEGGDHVFLVINKRDNRNITDPEKWSDDVMICDPWSNEVYPAKEYKAKLKNFTFDHLRQYNMVEDFDSKRHILLPKENFNTEYLRHHRSIDTLRLNLTTEIKHFVSILQAYREDLSMIYAGLNRETNKGNEKKAAILQNKLARLDEHILALQKKKREKPAAMAYRDARKELNQKLRDVYREGVGIMQFSEEERAELFKQQSGVRKKRSDGLFEHRTGVGNELRTAAEKVNSALKKK